MPGDHKDIMETPAYNAKKQSFSDRTLAGDTSSLHKRASCFPRPRLIVLFWMGAIIAVAVMARVQPAGWDAHVYWKAIQSLRRGADPYAEGIAAQRAFPHRPAPSAPEQCVFTYVYSPLTLPLLRLLAALPGGLLGVLYGLALAAGTLLEVWSGFQMAVERERRWLALMLPAVAFFPGLIVDDVILSGNAAYILYGLILAAAVPGWKSGRWFWYYLAVLAASICKAPMLTLLTFPILVGKRQWVPACTTAAAGLMLFAVQSRLWPELFREFLLAVRLQFDWNHDFGFSPAGLLGKILWAMGRPYSPATTVLYLVFASVLGIVLLELARRVRLDKAPRETWIPVALVGTFLLNPRIMKYDLAAITVPMLLIGWRTLRYALKDSSSGKLGRSLRFIGGTPTGAAPPARSASNRQNRPNLALVLVGSACFLTPNLLSATGPPWWPIELAVLLAVFTLGIWSLYLPQLEAQP